MAESIGKELRMAEWFHAGHGGAVLVDMSVSGAEGAVSGLEDPAGAVGEVGPTATGLILNPGMMERLASQRQLPGKRGAAPLVRVDWTNALRPEGFLAPPRHVRRVMISSAEDALDLGADAIVTYILLGFDEDFEAENIQSFAFLARECSRLGLPLAADIHAAGPKVGKANFADAVKLGAAQAVEGGADAFIMPYPGEDALAMIRRFSPVPVFLRVDGTKGADGESGLPDEVSGADWGFYFEKADGIVFAGREFWASAKRAAVLAAAREAAMRGAAMREAAAREAGGSR